MPFGRAGLDAGVERCRHLRASCGRDRVDLSTASPLASWCTIARSQGNQGQVQLTLKARSRSGEVLPSGAVWPTPQPPPQNTRASYRSAAPPDRYPWLRGRVALFGFHAGHVFADGGGHR